MSAVVGLLSQPFMSRAVEAGTVIAVACGLIGYFLVLRAQVFAADALSHVAFTGALAALAAGIDLRLGLFAVCVVFGAMIAMLGAKRGADDVVIGNAFAWVLGLGALFLTLYASRSGNGVTGVSVLFGSIFGLTSSQTVVAVAIGLGLVAAILVIARPLLFASVDEAVAAAAGLPVRLLGVIFLALVGIAAGEATQAVGSLLLLGLLAAPPATAVRLTHQPWVGLVLSAGISAFSMLGGLLVSYYWTSLPPSFSILAVGTGSYVVSLIGSRHRVHDGAHLRF